VAIRAAALLKKMFPRLQLLVAGAHQRHGIRKDGYIAWIESLTRQLDLSQNVAWLGSLDASEMCKELNSASAMILPSFVENCSGFMQEAMMVGTPVVASYAGGLPSLAGGEKSALFFPPGDAAMCAWQIQRLLTDRDLANRLSHSARAIALDRNDRAKIVANQIKTYRQVIAESRKE
jgi:glycosyltransferase involved in cell wall biosynthesis